MLRSPQVQMTEEQWRSIVASKKERSVRNWMTVKSILMPRKDSVITNNDRPSKDQRVWIPSPVISSTDAFRLNTGLTPLPPKMTPLPDELPTNGDAWHHSQMGH